MTFASHLPFSSIHPLSFPLFLSFFPLPSFFLSKTFPFHSLYLYILSCMPNKAKEYKKIPKSCVCIQIYVYINMYKIAMKIVWYIYIHIYRDIFCILILLDSPELSDIFPVWPKNHLFFFSNRCFLSKIYYFLSFILPCMNSTHLNCPTHSFPWAPCPAPQ